MQKRGARNHRCVKGLFRIKGGANWRGRIHIFTNAMLLLRHVQNAGRSYFLYAKHGCRERERYVAPDENADTAKNSKCPGPPPEQCGLHIHFEISFAPIGQSAPQRFVWYLWTNFHPLNLVLAQGQFIKYSSKGYPSQVLSHFPKFFDSPQPV